jgi:peptidoglycan/xylan/chitin deacetylase (PgdA/CDA1 family)
VSALRARLSQTLIDRANIRRSLDADKHAIALTFDDGPDPVHTPAILDELRRLGIPATFFLVGTSAHDNPAIIRRMLAEGHAIGSHSESHPDPWRLGFRAVAREYRSGRSLVENAAGQSVHLFRPPKGYVDARGAAAMLLGRLRPWLWTIDAFDWEPGADAAAIVERVSGLAGGDIVLLHDAIKAPIDLSTLDRTATCAALPGIVALARDRSLRFVTLG